MIGALIGAGLSAVSSVVGGIAARKERDKARRMMQQQLRENQASFNTQYYSDPTKKGDTIRLLTELDKRLKQRSQAARGTKEMMGGTDDSLAEVERYNNEARTDTIGNLVAANENRKDIIRNNYENRKAAIQGQIIQDQYNQANDIARTAQGVAQVGANVANGLDSVKDKAQKAGDVATNEPPVDTGKALEDQLMKRYGGGDLFNRNGGASV